MSFLCSYFGLVEETGEQAVCCPFDHRTINGLAYQEQRPSAHVNTTTKMFHCMACGAGHNEVSFIQAVLGCDFAKAKKLLAQFNGADNTTKWSRDLVALSDEVRNTALQLGISNTQIDELQLKHTPDGGLVFPVFMYQQLVDTRIYRPGHHPKVVSRSGASAGLILPFDLWQQSNKVTILCAGEKDMAVTRSYGFNAITLTGGEQMLPIIPRVFKGRKVVICYDNDMPGKAGALRVAQAIVPYAEWVKVVTKFHEVCQGEGEDLTDYFIKYQKQRQDLIQCIEDTALFIPSVEESTEAEVSQGSSPQISLLQASTPRYVNRLVESNIQVVAVSDASFIAPTQLYAEKTQGEAGAMALGDIHQWEIIKSPEGILHLLDNNFTEEQIFKNKLRLLKVSPKEKGVLLSTTGTVSVHKAYVTDYFETASPDTQPMEYTAYSIGCKLESGKRYRVRYKLVPHPYKGQQLTMVVTNALQASDSVSSFGLTDAVKAQLRLFQEIPGDVETKVAYLADKVKGILGYNGNDTLIQAMDLAYHTVLQFNFGSFKNERGYLDTLIVGESRVGKSSTANALRNTYQLGTFTSLAGNSATIPGLVGGSNKVGGNYQTRAGVIPQNHKGLIIFEEFAKSNSPIVKELTDIRSSNEVRIARVSGTITLPALVRMITLTNTKNPDGQIRPIASYPNGVAVITDLIGTAEDIARYDMLVVLSDRGASQIDPLWVPPTPLPIEAYQARIRWVWSRSSEQVIFAEGTAAYIVQQANQLNQQYECHIKIFGTEAWKKLARLAIAVAGYTVSTDADMDNIIVTNECVDYAVAFLQRLYDNPTFKLKEFVDEERMYTTTDAQAIAILQALYNGTGFYVIDALRSCSQVSKNMLGASTGRGSEELSKLLTQLSRHKFIRFSNYNIIPTERFRLTVPHLQAGHAEQILAGEGVSVQHA